MGVIVSCAAKDFLEARIELDEARLAAFAPRLDMEAIRAHLASIPCIGAGGPYLGPIGRLSPRERFHLLVAPRSTIIQTSRVHTGRCSAAAAAAAAGDPYDVGKLGIAAAEVMPPGADHRGMVRRRPSRQMESLSPSSHINTRCWLPDISRHLNTDRQLVTARAEPVR